MARPAAPPTSSSAAVGTLGIADAARAVGVSPSALRLWERQGLVQPLRTSGGARRYRAADVARLQAIHRYRTVDGLNAAAIRRLLASGPTAAHRIEADPAEAGAPGGAHRRGLSEPPTDGGAGATGRRLRELRTSRGYTLKSAAVASGLSLSFISALERGLSGASITALRRLLAVYGTTLGEILEDPTVNSRRLVTEADRRVLDTGDGVRIENLAMAPSALEPQLFVLAAGASSEGMYAHAGEEFMFVLSGALSVWLGDVEYYRLAAGDALTFPSSLPHRFQAVGPDETRLLWINTPPTF